MHPRAVHVMTDTQALVNNSVMVPLGSDVCGTPHILVGLPRFILVPLYVTDTTSAPCVCVARLCQPGRLSLALRYVPP